jgi:hypothetical protein
MSMTLFNDNISATSYTIPKLSEIKNNPALDIYLITGFSDDKIFANYKNQIYIVTDCDSYSSVAIHGLPLDIIAYQTIEREMNMDTQNKQKIKNQILETKIKNKINESIELLERIEDFSSLDTIKTKKRKIKKKVPNSKKIKRKNNTKKNYKYDKKMEFISHTLNDNDSDDDSNDDLDDDYYLYDDSNNQYLEDNNYYSDDSYDSYEDRCCIV